MKKSKFVALVLIFALFFSVVNVKPARAGWAWELGKIFLVGRLSSKCNTMRVENLSWSFPSQALTGTVIK
ncbi:MAG: hypothetical protein IJP69_06810 [Synergistaceae bacterium]|nr:hypothetical protein [Synergistaceae bacterium]